jgi:hypothetical protein
MIEEYQNQNKSNHTYVRSYLGPLSSEKIA